MTLSDSYVTAFLDHELRDDISAEPMSDDFLKHFGVLGMKWGVRNDRSGSKGSKKASSTRSIPELERSADDFIIRVAVNSAPGVRRQMKRLSKSPKYRGIDLTSNPDLRNSYVDDVRGTIQSIVNKNSEKQPKDSNTTFDVRRVNDYDLVMRTTTTFEGGGQYIRGLGGINYIEPKVRHADDGPEVREFAITQDLDELGHILSIDIDDAVLRQSIQDDEVDSWIRHELLGEYLSHFGTLGMKWGVRNSESKARIKRAKKEDSSSEKRKNNSLRNNPKNRRMTDAELSKMNNRLRLEREFAQLTHIPKPAASESRVKNMLKDVAFDVTKGALTTVGKEILTKALKTQFNKVAAPDFRVDVKEAKKAADTISKALEIAQ